MKENAEKKLPENALIYTNQAYPSTVQSGKLAIYCHNFILGQLLVATNQPEKTDEYVCKKNEIKLITWLNDTTTGVFNGLRLQLAYIILCGDKGEAFFSYGVDNKKSTVLYSVSKEIIPNALVSTCFNKHFNKIIDERRHKEESSTFFFFLPSLTDRKGKIIKFRDNVSLNRIDCSLQFLNSFLPDKTAFNLIF